MKEKLRRIMDAIHRYNSEHMAMQAFGLSDEAEYDTLVIAPSFTPYKLKMDQTCRITTMREGAYIAGYLVEKDGLRIAWVKITWRYARSCPSGRSSSSARSAR